MDTFFGLPILPEAALKKQPTYWEKMQQKGYSRRDFLKFCTYMSAFIGLEASGVTKVAQAMQSNARRYSVCHPRPNRHHQAGL